MRWRGSMVLVAALLSLCAAVSGDQFLYFAYGSNLLANRIHIKNPSAQFVGAAVLDEHRLDFIRNSSYWNGAVSTIVPDPTHGVWGAVWRLDSSNLASLDRQEGVHMMWYFAKSVNVTTKSGQVVVARTYVQTENPTALTEHQLLPMERRPSVTYLKVIIQGAIECAIPEDYIRYLYSIPHNGQDASPEIMAYLGDLEAVSLYPSRFFPRQHLSKAGLF